MKTPITPIKIPQPLKDRAKAKAIEESTNLSQLVIRLLNDYLKKN